MLNFRRTLCCALLGALLLLPDAVLAQKHNAPASIEGVAIAVADFDGSSHTMSRFISDTLLTDLAQSPYLRMVERSEIGRALTELRLQATGLTAPQQVQKLGRLIGADRLVVGSYMSHDGIMIINARLLDVHTGRLEPQGAANVSGPSYNILDLVNKLAERFHLEITGRHLVLKGQGQGTIHRAAQQATYPPAEYSTSDTDQPTRSIPPILASDSQTPFPFGPPNGIVDEEAMGSLTNRLGGAKSFFTVTHPYSAVTRIRVLVAVMRTLFPHRFFTDSGSLHLPDAARVPFWALPYVIVAVKQNIWHASQMLYPNQVATWTYVETLVARLQHLEAQRTQAVLANVAIPPAIAPNAPTGLLIDTRGLGLNRSMSFTIYDENGNEIYPRPNHMPSPSYVEQNGTAFYVHDTASAVHVGSHPLRVNAISCQNGNVVVSSRTARRILRANRQNHFLWNYRVCILIDPGH